MDKYTNIAELKQYEREDKDYTILYRELPSKITIKISRGLRETLFDNLGHRSLRRKTIVFYQIVDILKEALLLFLRKK
jgi:hypothetical protein